MLKTHEIGNVALGYAKVANYEELLAVLSSAHADLPKRLRQVAVYMTQHPSDVALGTIGAVAIQVGVQPSTLVRFAKFFGFHGFSDFQEIFKNHVRSAGSAPRIAPRSQPKAGIIRFPRQIEIAGHVAAARESLDRFEQSFNGSAFRKMVGTLAKAKAIYVVGSKRAFPVANYMSLTFSQLGVKNTLVDNVGSTAFDQVACLDRGDAVLAISFSPYNSITPELASRARDRGAKVVSLTDSMLSPLIGLSRASLVVVESSAAGYRSMAATNVAALSIVLGVAEARSAVSRRVSS
jgi:DNA-binding MurR/RpiR family transcriptional regulator